MMNIPDLLSMPQARLPINEINGSENLGVNDKTNADGSASFTDTLKGFIQDVNSMQKDSAHKSERFLKGEAVDMHDVMIAAEKAKTSFQLLMELRNKTLDVYNQATRINV